MPPASARNFGQAESARPDSEFTTGGSPREEDFSGLASVSAASVVGPNVVLYTADVNQCMAEILTLARRRGFELRDMQFRNASLDDVFLELTGRMLRE